MSCDLLQWRNCGPFVERYCPGSPCNSLTEPKRYNVQKKGRDLMWQPRMANASSTRTLNTEQPSWRNCYCSANSDSNDNKRARSLKCNDCIHRCHKDSDCRQAMILEGHTVETICIFEEVGSAAKWKHNMRKAERKTHFEEKWFLAQTCQGGHSTIDTYHHPDLRAGDAPREKHPQ